MMKNKKYIIIIIILAILLLISLGYSVLTSMNYFYNYSPEVWFREECSHNYIINGSKIGNNFGALGDGSHVKISIDIYKINDNKEKNKVISFETIIQDENNSIFGNNIKLSEDNYEIIDNDDYLKIILYNQNKTVAGSYRFYYSDFEN